jgi:hypothetical protein
MWECHKKNVYLLVILASIHFLLYTGWKNH